MLSPERLSLPGPEYLAQRHVLTYMEDAVSQLLENREDISQYGIARFFTEYFNSVRQGTHILFREFSFVQATPHNRASFLRTFWRCFRTVGKNGDLLTAQEYHCLLQLLCPDFPMELTQKAARIVLMDDAMDCLMSFSDFLFAFQIQFYYSEFLESVAGIYQDLLAGKNPNTVIVPTSSSGQHRQRQPPNDCSPLDGVEASLFYQCLESLCDRSKYSCPPSALVKEMLSSAQRLTFYGFLMALAKDQGINRALEGCIQEVCLNVWRPKHLSSLISTQQTIWPVRVGFLCLWVGILSSASRLEYLRVPILQRQTSVKRCTLPEGLFFCIDAS
uniref:Centriolar satellite-associated tubulin polyglutamylase complex regulator 1 n=1 Tax=Accipiter nisus TaxID=211598 RepID=A0A8B9MDT9_9AVES